MKKTITIKNEETRQHAIKVISELPLDHIVEIKPLKKQRSLEQNAYYWKLLRVIGADTGYSPDELHTEMKRRFLLPMLIEKEPELEEMAMAHESALSRVLSTTVLSVREFSQYIQYVEELAVSLGIRLPAKDEA